MTVVPQGIRTHPPPDSDRFRRWLTAVGASVALAGLGLTLWVHLKYGGSILASREEFLEICGVALATLGIAAYYWGAPRRQDDRTVEVNVAKVLVVDDEAEVRRVVRVALTRAGHEVWDAGDGTEALGLLDTIPFDLVITDVYMAGMDGMELLVRIQQRGLRVPVVAISGGGYRSREEVLRMAASCGAVATLDKPFTPEQLRETIEPLLKPAVRS